MKVRLKHSVSVFLRDGGKVGYIANRYNQDNRAFDEAGADFLNALEYQYRATEDLVDKKLHPLYHDADRAELLSDFEDFVKELEAEGYVETKSKGNGIFDVVVELTNGCNERCVHCYLPNSVKKENLALPKETIVRIIDELTELGGTDISFTGGEALLSPNISLVRYAYEKGLGTSVLSNLTVLSDSHVRLFSECQTYVQVSLYSTNPAEQDAITLRRGSCEQTMNAIRKLRQANVPVTISCVLMKENMRAYPDVVKFAEEVGARVQISYYLQAEIDGDVSNLSHRLSSAEVKEVLRDLLRNHRDKLKPVPFFNDRPITLEDWMHAPLCSACNSSVYITSSGDVQPCAGWPMTLGNINESSLSEIFDAIDNRMDIPFTRERFPQCFNCDAKDFCAFCLSFNATDNDGNYLKLSPYMCELAKLYKEVYLEMNMA